MIKTIRTQSFGLYGLLALVLALNACTQDTETDSTAAIGQWQHAGANHASQKYAALGKCSKATATRDLGDLLAKKCVWSEGVGRGLRYFIALSPAPGA